MASFKIAQTLGALVLIAGFFLPWSRVNFGAPLNKAVDLVQKVVPGGIGSLGKLGDPNVAAAAAMNAATTTGIVAQAKGILDIPTGQFSGLDIARTGKFMLLAFVLPALALVVLLLSWLTPLGTGRLGTMASTACLMVLLGTLVLSFMTGTFKDVQSTVTAGAGMAAQVPGPQGVGDALKMLTQYLMWGFWLSLGGALVMLISSPFAKKREA